MNSKHRVRGRLTVWVITIRGNDGQCSDEKMGTGPNAVKRYTRVYRVQAVQVLHKDSVPLKTA